jgi:hypothetical protein
MKTYISLSDILLSCSINTGGLPDILLEGISCDIGWEEFVTGARREGLSESIYYYQHEAFGNGLVPDFVTDALKQDFHLTTRANEQALAFLERTADSLTDIDLIVAKGAGLMFNEYEHPGLRRFHDIDILVRKKDLVDLEERLTEIGLRRKGDDGENSSKGNALNDNKGLVYLSDGDGPNIHIHWNLVSQELQEHQGIVIDNETIWDKAIRIRGNLFSLCTEHQIIHLSENAVRHSFQRLCMLRDLHEVYTRHKKEIDQEYLVQCSQKWNLSKCVYFCLCFLNIKLGMGARESLLEGLQKPPPGMFGNLFLNRLLKDHRTPELCNMAWLDMQPSFSEKRQFLRRVAILPHRTLSNIYHVTDDSITVWFYIRRVLAGLINLAVAASLSLAGRPGR